VNVNFFFKGFRGLPKLAAVQRCTAVEGFSSKLAPSPPPLRTRISDLIKYTDLILSFANLSVKSNLDTRTNFCVVCASQCQFKFSIFFKIRAQDLGLARDPEPRALD